MNNIPPAEVMATKYMNDSYERTRKVTFDNKGYVGWDSYNIAILLKEFAQLHVKAALQSAAKKLIENGQINTIEILDAYPETNII